MAATYGLWMLLVLASFVYTSSGLCQMHPVNNSRDVCETRFNIQRHELVGGLKTIVEVADVCSIYPQYEECLKDLIKDCPKDQSFLDMQGYDQESTLVAFKGFCADRQVYLSGVPCYAKNIAAIRACFLAHSAGRDDALQEVHSSREWDKFYESLCPIQWDGAKCISQSVASCSTAVQKTITNLAYSLMHGRCKIPKYGDFISDYDTKYGSSASRLSQLPPLSSSFLLLILSIFLCG